MNMSTLVLRLSDDCVCMCIYFCKKTYSSVISIVLLQESGVTKEIDEVRNIVETTQPSLNTKIHLVFGEAGI